MERSISSLGHQRGYSGPRMMVCHGRSYRKAWSTIRQLSNSSFKIHQRFLQVALPLVLKALNSELRGHPTMVTIGKRLILLMRYILSVRCQAIRYLRALMGLVSCVREIVALIGPASTTPRPILPRYSPLLGMCLQAVGVGAAYPDAFIQVTVCTQSIPGY